VRKKFDCVIITNIPNYYKINLYNAISSNQEILVIFMANTSNERNPDFYSLSNSKFEYFVLTQNSIERRNIFFNAIKLFRLLRTLTCKNLIISEWFGLEYWISLLLKKFNSTIVFTLESNLLIDTPTTFLKTLAKKVFIHGVDLALVSGPSHSAILRKLGFKKEIIITNGVGISNNFSYIRPSKLEYDSFRILFVGRLIEEKNIRAIMKSFNLACKHRKLHLTIVGEGLLKPYVLQNLNENITYIEKVANEEMHSLYEKNDILILPSLVEPWGLVVEEALSSQMPVIISQFVGCLNSIVFDGKNGLVVDARNEDSIVDGILSITSKETYKRLQSNASLFDCEMKDKKQLEVYLNNLK
jgi:glycosyltransferase involved in cell wall biosynthesis